MRAALTDRLYICYFQQPGVADAELGADPRESRRRLLCAASGEGTMGGVPVVPQGGGFLDMCPEPDGLPPWLTEDDIDVFAAEFAESGFTRPLNWYRNLDRTWELTAAWRHAKITVPALFLAGDVMVGRGIDQVLPHPGDPRLYEPSLDSAQDYVALAEAASGSIAAPVDFGYVWGDALGVLAAPLIWALLPESRTWKNVRHTGSAVRLLLQRRWLRR